MKLPITVIILTFNEQKNIVDCIESILPHFNQILVVDSFSTDKTLSILDKYGIKYLQNPFTNYAQQRNWAFALPDIANEWILNMDADHRATPELILDLKNQFSTSIPQDLNGFLVSRKTIFLGKWIKYGGHYPTYHAIIFRKNKGFCEPKNYDQHFVIEGKTMALQSDMIDIITDSLDTFIARHNHWAKLEAQEIINENLDSKNLIKPNKNGNPIEQRRYMKMKYYTYPIFLRSFIYFIYRYFFKMGFRDGKIGLIFHGLQCLWFRFLVDAKIYELKIHAKSKTI